MLISQGHPNAITSTLSAFKCLLPFPLLLNFSLFYIRLAETFSTLKAESSSLTIPFPFSPCFSALLSQVVFYSPLPLVDQELLWTLQFLSGQSLYPASVFSVPCCRSSKWWNKYVHKNTGAEMSLEVGI